MKGKIILGIAGALGLLALAGKAKETVSQFAYQIVGYGLPKFNNLVLTLPVHIRFNNPLPTSLTFDRFRLEVYMLQGGTMFQQVATIDEPLSIAAGVSTRTLNPRVDLRSFFNDFLKTFESVVNTNKVTFRIDIIATAAGITLPTQSNLVEVDLDLSQSFNGLGYVASSGRRVKPVPSWAKAIVPKPTDNYRTLKDDQEDIERDTLPLMKAKVKRTLHHTRKLADKLKGNTLQETARNNWHFIHDHIKYEKDMPGVEEIRSPRRLIHEGKGDCDCFTVALSSLLTNQGHPHYMRIMKENGNPYWSHVYVIVPKDGKLSAHGPDRRSDYLVLDAVTDAFDFEPRFTDKKDFPVWP